MSLNSKNNVRTRIAPSPTGIPHIGNTRTALFNYLFAKKNKGQFIVRIEDTDRARFVPGAVDAIFEILEWLGLSFDEKYVQSERLDIYKKHAEILKEKGFIYEDLGALRFRMPKDGKTSWVDAIGNKEIVFDNKTQEDFIAIKSDGYPTYNFAHVIDDHLMDITYVIRGVEFISSTPKHIQLYKAFGWEIPVLAHLPVIVGPDHKKLSKRHGAKSALDYRNEGYLKEALINFMALLGWSPGKNQEIMTFEEMIELFDLKDVNLASPVFDLNKLIWMNGAYIRKTQNSNLKSQIYEFYKRKYPLDLIEKTVPLVQDRIKKLSDYLPLTEFFFEEPKEYEIDLSGKKNVFEKVYNKLENVSKWQSLIIGEVLQKAAKDLNIKNSEFFMFIRVAVTGKKVSPPLNESIEILGKEETILRIKKLL